MNNIETSTITPEILRNFPNPVFVETGTYKGGGIECAMMADFPNIYSIELDPGFAERAKNLYFDSNIHIICGDSSVIFGDVINKINQPITFFLDSHKQVPNQPAKSTAPDEVKFIAQHPLKDKHTILIDDIRLFREGIWGISLNYLLDLVYKIKPNPKISYIDNKLFTNDIMVIQ